ncbi:MAG: hypothetical protein WB558_08630 [Terriglobales bacterium]
MKKVSTAGVKQSKNCSDQKLTIGLDLGDRRRLELTIEAFDIRPKENSNSNARTVIA